MAESLSPLRCGVLGDPISHSLSPVLHRAAYAELGLDWVYDAYQVSSGGLPEFLATCGPEWRGLSLTMPLKREALDLADVVSERAVAAGAVNTLVFEGGRLFADNTDVPGASAAIRERSRLPIRNAAILGGGATAGSVMLALAEDGCRRFTLHVRSPERAAETLAVAERFRETLAVAVVGLDQAIAGDILVSTIPASAQSPELVASCAGVSMLFDVIYDSWPTPLAAAAIADGRAVVGGLDLLVHQAALQFALFSYQLAPLEAMRRAGESAIS